MWKNTVNFDLLIPLTSGDPMKLAGSKFKTNRRKYSFTKLVIKLRNSFPQDAMEANNIKEFKKGLDKFMEDMCTDSYQKQRSRQSWVLEVLKLFTSKSGKAMQGKTVH